MILYLQPGYLPVGYGGQRLSQEIIPAKTWVTKYAVWRIERITAVIEVAAPRAPRSL